MIVKMYYTQESERSIANGWTAASMKNDWKIICPSTNRYGDE